MIVVDRKTKLTYEDYLQFPDDGRRHEIIDGNHYVSGAPFVPHQRILKKLLIQLCRRIDDTGLGEVLPAPVATVLSDTDVVEPDLVVVLEPNASVITRERIDGAPDLVVEILSPSTAHRDRGLKLDLYQKSGVAESTGSSIRSAASCTSTCWKMVYSAASGEHAERITVACTAGRGGQPIRIDLTETVW